MANLTINGKSINVDVEDDTPLLWAIRENVGLTGTKYGCGIAQCGACTVHIDGVAMRSCGISVSEAAGKQITMETVIDPACEGLFLDPAKLKQVLYNYLSNALKFTPENGRVIIRARLEDTELFRIEVEDHAFFACDGAQRSTVIERQAGDTQITRKLLQPVVLVLFKIHRRLDRITGFT